MGMVVEFHDEATEEYPFGYIETPMGEKFALTDPIKVFGLPYTPENELRMLVAEEAVRRAGGNQ